MRAGLPCAHGFISIKPPILARYRGVHSHMDVSRESPMPSPRMLCLGCGYTLDHLDQRCCPECGRAFDPADSASYAAPTNCQFRGASWKVTLLLTTCSLYLSVPILVILGKLEPLWALVTPGWPARGSGHPSKLTEWLASAVLSVVICLSASAFARISDSALVVSIVFCLLYGAVSVISSMFIGSFGFN